MKEPGYRLNVALVVINKDKKVLICKRKNMNSWQFPQGGIDDGESPLKSAKRELFEEVGIPSKSVKLISSTEDWFKYEVPSKSRRRNFLDKKFKGQKQKWFMFKLIEDVEITFDYDPANEFEEYMWVSYWYPLNVIVSFKQRVYCQAMNSLRNSFHEEFSNV